VVDDRADGEPEHGGAESFRRTWHDETEPNSRAGKSAVAAG
jgi:hypothetical protein